MTREQIIAELRRRGYSVTPPARTSGALAEQAIVGLRAKGYTINTETLTITPPAPRAANAATREYWALRHAYRARTMVSK